MKILNDISLDPTHTLTIYYYAEHSCVGYGYEGIVNHCPQLFTLGLILGLSIDHSTLSSIAVSFNVSRLRRHYYST